MLSGELPATGLVDRVELGNRLVPHNYSVPVDREMVCDHPGCSATFVVRLIPGQLVYPRWCPFHRPPHRRNLSV